MPDREATARIRSQYDRYAPHYDLETSWYERLMLGDGRRWACGRAHGRVLEVAIGTGRNLPNYSPGVEVIGIDLSSAMLRRARLRSSRPAAGPVPPTQLVQADAEHLPFAADSFDSVLCTLGLSSIPDHRAAIAEIARVLRPEGHLITLGHVATRNPMAARLQQLLQWTGARRVADCQTRDVASTVRAAGFRIIEHRHSRGGIIERLVAAAPPHPTG